jgi:hypothetical protein
MAISARQARRAGFHPDLLRLLTGAKSATPALAARTITLHYFTEYSGASHLVALLDSEPAHLASYSPAGLAGK